LNLRASGANAFRNPTVFDLYRTWRAASGTLFLSNPNLEPERLASWEVGVRKRFGEGVADIDAAFFENRVRNLIYRITDFNADPAGLVRPVTNAAHGVTRGLEIGATQRIRQRITLRQTYTYTDASIGRNPRIPNTEGKRIPNVPRNAASFGLIAARSRFSGSLTGRYLGLVYNTDTNTDFVKGVPGSYDQFFEMDLSAGFQINPNLTAQFSADNLLNRIYYTFTPSPGRMIYAGLRIRFGRSNP
jgi:iron complex outermembrane receptor protein